MYVFNVDKRYNLNKCHNKMVIVNYLVLVHQN